MAWLVKTRKENDKEYVYARHPHPERLSDAQKKSGTIVQEMPEREKRLGKTSRFVYDPDKEEVYVEYKDRPLTPEEMEVEEAKEKFREEGREEIKQKVYAASKEKKSIDDLTAELDEKETVSK